MSKKYLRVNLVRTGDKIIHRNEPYIVECYNFYKPGKGQSLVILKLRKILKNSLLEIRFKSNELVEIAKIFNQECKYLYTDQKNWFFITDKDYEIISISKEMVAEQEEWLISEIIYSMVWWDHILIGIQIPNFIIMQVIEIEYNETNIQNVINNNCKLATMSNGVQIKVPIFIKKYDFIKIDTREKIYVNRIKENILYQ